MPPALKAWRRRLPALSPWAVLAAVLAVAVLGLHGWLGIRYARAAGDQRVLAGRLGAARAPAPLDAATAESALEARARALAALRAAFEPQDSEALLMVVADAAMAAGAALVSLEMGDQQPRTERGVQYATQPLVVRLGAGPREVSRFLEVVWERLPSASVAGLRMADLAGSPSAEVQIRVYSSPEAVATAAAKP